MIRYTDALDGITADHLTRGFFEGWGNPPSPEVHHRVLKGSTHVWIARAEGTPVVGYITAITDGVLAAYIPHLEVLPAYRKQGIGGELVRRMIATLRDFYMIDLICDADVQPFYQRLGMRPYTGMILRHYDRQKGE